MSFKLQGPFPDSIFIHTCFTLSSEKQTVLEAPTRWGRNINTAQYKTLIDTGNLPEKTPQQIQLSFQYRIWSIADFGFSEILGVFCVYHLFFFLLGKLQFDKKSLAQFSFLMLGRICLKYKIQGPPGYPGRNLRWYGQQIEMQDKLREFLKSQASSQHSIMKKLALFWDKCAEEKSNKANRWWSILSGPRDLEKLSILVLHDRTHRAFYEAMDQLKSTNQQLYNEFQYRACEEVFEWRPIWKQGILGLVVDKLDLWPRIGVLANIDINYTNSIDALKEEISLNHLDIAHAFKKENDPASFTQRCLKYLPLLIIRREEESHDATLKGIEDSDK